VFVRIPGTANVTVTFVGEVPQGTLSTPLPTGFFIVSSQVPQSGTATALGYVPQAGDALYFWDEPGQKYVIRGWDAEFGEFDGPLPVLEVGEAFFTRKTTAGTWTRTFSVNQ